MPLAVAIVYSKWIENMLYPLLVGSQAIPKIAIAPLLLVWLGFGMTSKILVAFLIAFFPVVVATATGLRGRLGGHAEIGRVDGGVHVGRCSVACGFQPRFRACWAGSRLR